MTNQTSFWKTLAPPILALAPMEGYTDTAFRRICKERGAEVVYTEFISSDAIAHRAPTALKKLEFDPSERPVVCQIFGNSVSSFVAAAREIQARGFSGIDVNLGCPARKVVTHGSGVALMRDPQFARTLIGSIADIVSIPISIKVRASIRSGTHDGNGGASRHTAVDLVSALRGIPIAAIMVHGRSFEGGFSGSIDADMIRAVKRSTDALVIANGGVRTPGDARAMLASTGADGVGIARGCLGMPWLFRSIRSELTGTPDVPVSRQEWLDTVTAHLRLMIERKGDHGLYEFRKHLTHYFRGFRNASQLRSQAVRANSVNDVIRIVGSADYAQEEWAPV